MNLRPLKTDDLALLFAIHRSVFRSHIEKLWGWDEDWQCENFKSECAVAATSVIEIAGYIQFLDRRNQIYLQNIAIAAAFQGKGVCSNLLMDLQSRAASQRVPFHLGAFKTNASAIKLYNRLGFRNVAKRPPTSRCRGWLLVLGAKREPANLFHRLLWGGNIPFGDWGRRF